MGIFVSRAEEYRKVINNAPQFIYHAAVTSTRTYHQRSLESILNDLEQAQKALYELKRAIIFIKNIEDKKEEGPISF